MSQISMQSSEFGKSVALYVRYRVLEDSTKAPATGETIYAGNALYLHSDSTLKRVLTNVAVYGLAKANMNSYRNEVNDASFGIYGSGLMTVVIMGIVDLTPSTFPNTDGSYTTVQSWDTSLTYHAGDSLYVQITGAKAGLLTNVKVVAAQADRNDNTFVGTVLLAPTDTTAMQILLG